MLLIVAAPVIAQESVCFGTASNGRLENGERLPLNGDNFDSYSAVGSVAGRTYVHRKVRAVMVAAYGALQSSAPGKVFVYGETGLKAGGPFKPHKTHQNGLSVDFMVPVLQGGKSVPLPTSAFNKFGYGIEFDSAGRYENYGVDFDAMAQHLLEIRKAADVHGVKISRVIFDVPLQQYLFRSKAGPDVRKLLKFSTKPAWVRHDEHYHVDFEVPCKPMQG